MEKYYCQTKAQTPGTVGIISLQRVKSYFGKYVTVKAYGENQSVYETAGFLSGILAYPVFTLVVVQGGQRKYICMTDVIEIVNMNGRGSLASFGK